jgi:hypothetical protein
MGEGHGCSAATGGQSDADAEMIRASSFESLTRKPKLDRSGFIARLA